MNRREFLKYLSAAGMVSSAPALFMEQAMASSSDAYTGPLLMLVKAQGGFQQTAFCDPKSTRPNWGQTTTGSDVGQAGNLMYAPVQENKMLFEKYHDRMLVINGVQWSSNGHGGASLCQQSGKATPSMPAFSALAAKIKGSGLPLSWLAAYTGRLTGAVQNFSPLPGTSTAQRLGNSNQVNGRNFFDPQVLATLRRYQNERIEQIADSNRMPYVKAMANDLHDARNNTGLLKNLAAEFKGAVFDTQDHRGKDLQWASGVHQMLLAMKAGVTVSGITAVTALPPEVKGMKPEKTFDTHGLTNNTNHLTFLALTRTIDYVWEKAEELGIADRLVVHVVSDVGRSIGGTGHSTIGSTILMAKNQPWTGRVVGVTTPNVKKVTIDPVTLQPRAREDGGVVLRSAHVQRTMRRIFGIDQHPLCQKYEFNDPQIDLLNPNYSTPWNV